MAQTFDHSRGEIFEHDGARLYYEVIGNEDKPALLYLHGGFGHIADINPILPALADDFKIIGIDSRGHGRSTTDSGEYTYARLQSDVEAVLEHLGIDTLSIIGFSDGGIVAYRLGVFSSLAISKLITVGARWHSKNNDGYHEFFQKLTGDIMKERQPEYYAAYQRLNPAPDFNKFIKELIPMWLDSTETGYPNENIERIDCPLMLIRGDKDHLFGLKEMVELSKWQKDAALFNIPFAGHAAFVDQGELFTLGLKQFLAS